ncbi:AfsA-related hotdog domain-containing protein, partial [Streptomyces sp. WELS2]|uniref:AfsA-related hotdog domain-containing protein n=1 Tax=Streptomyces sp. WELS2 TaxID=2749435 RepID=UPI002867B73B
HAAPQVRGRADVHVLVQDGRPAIAPALVGRGDASCVVLGAADAPDSWVLRVDPQHPLNVNRKRDHHPGILLMEAVQQVAHLVPRQPFYPETVRIQFHRYAELGVPCVIEARTVVQLGTGTELLTVRGTQGGQPVFAADLHNAAALAPADAR